MTEDEKPDNFPLDESRPPEDVAAGGSSPARDSAPAERMVPREEGVSGHSDEAPGEMSDGSVARSSTDEGAADASMEVDGATVEALLFSTHHPLTPARLSDLLGGVGVKAIRRAVQELNAQYEQSQRSFRIEQVAGGYQILTLPQHGEVLKRLHQKEIDSKLTRAALETLAIIAYKQPILRAEVEAIRGVASGETIRSLMEKHLVRIAGRAEEPGRPILYGTTKRFLGVFGLNQLKDLPTTEDARPQLPKPRTMGGGGGQGTGDTDVDATGDLEMPATSGGDAEVGQAVAGEDVSRPRADSAGLLEPASESAGADEAPPLPSDGGSGSAEGGKNPSAEASGAAEDRSA